MRFIILSQSAKEEFKHILCEYLFGKLSEISRKYGTDFEKKVIISEEEIKEFRKFFPNTIGQSIPENESQVEIRIYTENSQKVYMYFKTRSVGIDKNISEIITDEFLILKDPAYIDEVCNFVVNFYEKIVKLEKEFADNLSSLFQQTNVFKITKIKQL